MTFHIITIFPKIFESYFNESIIKRAQKNNLIKINIHNLRDWTADKHRTVDDTPYGGGAGMVMKVEPIYKAVLSIKYQVLRGGKIKLNTKYLIPNTKIILFSAKGKQWNQTLAKKYSRLDNVIMVCGRYEGVDERVKKFVDEEISVGPYVLTGGEIPAMILVDSITRLLPGVLGNANSIIEESFSSHNTQHITHNTYSLEYPQYTKPEVFLAEGKKYRVPKILLSGDHKKITEWRRKKMKLIDN
jgi:tRNA (guanine37-N1)-methyltransferase